mmetsp:Transcript_23025/g.79895  ORF Transcript_23025/g.79895 Transcript_23025/m.79895 type:complete len:253 (-) Transcript_23025:218-976(-)
MWSTARSLAIVSTANSSARPACATTVGDGPSVTTTMRDRDPEAFACAARCSAIAGTSSRPLRRPYASASALLQTKTSTKGSTAETRAQQWSTMNVPPTLRTRTWPASWAWRATCITAADEQGSSRPETKTTRARFSASAARGVSKCATSMDCATPTWARNVSLPSSRSTHDTPVLSSSETALHMRTPASSPAFSKRLPSSSRPTVPMKDVDPCTLVIHCATRMALAAPPAEIVARNMVRSSVNARWCCSSAT